MKMESSGLTKWKYWRTKDWNGLVEADNGEVSCTWFPECDAWSYLEPITSVRNEHWQETSRLEYLIRQGTGLPEPPPYKWSQRRCIVEVKDE